MKADNLNRDKLKSMGEQLIPKVALSELTENVINRVHELRQQRTSLRTWLSRPLITPLQLATAVALVLVVALPLLWLTLKRTSQNDGLQNYAAEKIVTRPVVFSYQSTKAMQVEVVGDFNGWQRGVHVLRNDGQGNFSLELMLPKGRYQYLFVVDGQVWQKDPQCKETVDDGFGSENSLLVL